MEQQYHKHYTREEAEALLPVIRQWLRRLAQLQGEIRQCDKRMQGMLAPGCDLGGEVVNCWVRCLTESKELLLEFYRREIEIKDLERGLIDFPAFIAGREAFLCWQHGEERVEFWHDLDAGFKGREPL